MTKGKKEIQSEETKQSSEQAQDMTHMRIISKEI